MSQILDGVIAANIIADMILKFRSAGINVTLDNIDEKIKALEMKNREGLERLSQ